LYIAVIIFVPDVVNDVLNVAVAPANVEEVAPSEATLTGLPIAVPPLKNVTVPVGPTVLTLEVETVAVSVTGTVTATVAGLGTTAAVVGAFVTVVEMTTGVVTAL